MQAAATAAATAAPFIGASPTGPRRFPGARSAVSGSSGAGLADPHISHLQLPLRQRQEPCASFFNYNPRFARLSAPTMATFPQPSDEMQRQQELARQWEPEPTGPLVSEYLSSSAITAEYANADPIYQAKTATLPHKYAHYRTCRGDGLCGWRAVAFCYFETLQRLGNKQKFLDEEDRLKSLAKYLHEVGFQEHQYEDFADEMFLLLRETASALDNPNGGAALLAAFNDPNRSMSILTYLKVLTSAWIQTHPSEYAAFVSQPLRTYCATHIEPTMSEIEHIGICGLVDALVKPAGIAVEILYLDRTPGDEANKYEFCPTDQHGIPIGNAPMIRLLYRPGHYDILYKAEDVPQRSMPPPVHPQIVVALNHASTEHYGHKTPYDLNVFEIPGMSVYSGPGYNWPPSQTYPFGTGAFPALSTSQVLPTPAYQQPASPVPTTEMFSPTFPVAVAQPPSPVGISNAVQHHHSLPIDKDGPFRPSIWEYSHALAPPKMQTAMCQTSIFKNSCFNTAHFNNPDFEPEQWHPELDPIPSDRSRKKSTNSS